MRLINAETLQLEEFNDISSRPAYAILSHKWVNDHEVSYQDMLRPHRQWMPGWAKIQFCCRQALADGLYYAWVDTCCIDKSSSSELSEAINSMYDWYADATCCYAYLNDVDLEFLPVLGEATEKECTRDTASPSVAVGIVNSLWFTRAWTLQELIAPSAVIFYDKQFREMTSKTAIAHTIEKRVRIPFPVLHDPVRIQNYSVAARMSWAAHRKASRVEDIAYSLFGIFEVNLPLLYGEGKRAFLRLQEEIIRQSHDHSIFVWESGITGPRSLLAPSPLEFVSSHSVELLTDQDVVRPYAVTNIGLSIELRVFPYTLDTYVALLNCRYGDSRSRVGVFLARDSEKASTWYRTTVNGDNVIPIDDLSLEAKNQVDLFTWQNMYISKVPMTISLSSRQSAAPQWDKARPFYGFKLACPSLLNYTAEFGRPYALVAYHDWDEAESFSLKLASAVQQHFGRGSKLAKQLLSSAGTQARGVGGHRLHSPNKWMEDFVDQGKRSLLTTADTYFASPSKVMQHDLSSKAIGLVSQPIGVLRMPCLSTGTAGMVFFDDEVHGIVAIKLGFSFRFQPVLLLATHRAVRHRSRHSNVQRPRFTTFMQFESGSSYSNQNSGVPQLIAFDVNSLGSLPSVQKHDDGSIEIGEGMYAFTPTVIDQPEHWVFKPYDDKPWYLLIGFEKRRTEDYIFWELTMDVREEKIAIQISDVDGDEEEIPA